MGSGEFKATVFLPGACLAEENHTGFSLVGEQPSMSETCGLWFSHPLVVDSSVFHVTQLGQTADPDMSLVFLPSLRQTPSNDEREVWAVWQTHGNDMNQEQSPEQQQQEQEQEQEQEQQQQQQEQEQEQRTTTRTKNKEQRTKNVRLVVRVFRPRRPFPAQTPPESSRGRDGFDSRRTVMDSLRISRPP